MMRCTTPLNTALILAALVCISGCASQNTYSTGTVSGRSIERGIPRAVNTAALSEGEQIAEHALAMIGTPYLYGGATPAGFDCSGLVHYAYLQAGRNVPRTSQAQFRAAKKIALRDAQQGDLLFFSDQEKLSHVGVYIGDDLFVHAPTSGRTVSVASLATPYYQMNLVGVGRLLN